MINTFEEKQVRTALRRTRSWLKRHPDKWITSKYMGEKGAYDITGRFWKELCPDALHPDPNLSSHYGPRLFNKAHGVLVVLVKRLEGNQHYPWGNDIKFGRINTINDFRLADATAAQDFVKVLEDLCRDK